MNNIWNRKECTPDQTIEKIKNIFIENKINIKLETFESKEFFYSTRLEIEGLPCIGTNGKGISIEYAKASAYAEFMERLQSGSLTSSLFTAFSQEKRNYNDEMLFDTEYIKDNYSEFFLILLNNNQFTLDRVFNSLLKDSSFRYCSPFYNGRTNEIEFLPIRLLELICGSNGLCAGNTMEEALVQGICEIMERFVHKNIYEENIVLPTIPQEELKECYSFRMIQVLEEKGFKIILKDCTLGGKYPVIGVIILDLSKSRYLFAIGADPDIDIALQRCFTEIFQGTNLDEKFSKNRMMPINYSDILNFKENWEFYNKFFYKRYGEWIKTLVSNSGQHPLTIFRDCNKEQIYQKAFMKKPFTNKEALQFLIGILIHDNKQLYIRDYSIMGFPTYRIYIPGMTECRILLNEEISLLEEETKLRTMFLDINNGRFENIKEFISIMQDIIKSPVLNLYGVIKTLFKIPNNSQKCMISLDDNFILAVCLLYCEDFTASSVYLKKFIRNNYYNGININYFIALLLYIINKNESIEDNKIKEIIDEIYGKDLGDELFFDLKNKIVHNKFFNITCPNCKICKLQENCYIENWKYINDILNKKKNNFVNSYDSLKSFFYNYDNEQLLM